MTRLILRPALMVFAAGLIALLSAQSVSAQEDDDSTRIIAFVHDDERDVEGFALMDVESGLSLVWREEVPLNVLYAPPFFSPDGRTAVVESYSWGEGDPVFYAWRSRDWFPLPCPDGDDYLGLFIDWSPDGRYALVICTQNNGPNMNYIVDTWNRETVLIPHFDVAVWSPRSTHLALRTVNREMITVIDLRGETVAEVASQEFAGLRWTPDGEHFFTLSRDAIHRFDMATGEMRTFSAPNVSEYYLSPDGEWLVYYDLFMQLQGSIYLPTGDRYSYAETYDRWLGDSPIQRFRGWSPDSRFIALDSGLWSTQVAGILRADMTGLLLLPENASVPRWSSTGRYLLYVHSEHTNTWAWSLSINRMDDEGIPQEEARFPVAQGQSDWAQWSPGDRYLVYIQLGTGTLMAWSPDWDEPRPLLDPRYDVQSFAFVEELP